MVNIHYVCSEKIAFPYIENVQSVIKKLPDDVQQKIHTDCIIYFIDATYGFSLGPSKSNIMLLNINQMNHDALSQREIQLVIAHEFAHIILDHRSSSTKEENEADELVAHWGFSL